MVLLTSESRNIGWSQARGLCLSHPDCHPQPGQEEDGEDGDHQVETLQSLPPPPLNLSLELELLQVGQHPLYRVIHGLPGVFTLLLQRHPAVSPCEEHPDGAWLIPEFTLPTVFIQQFIIRVVLFNMTVRHLRQSGYKLIIIILVKSPILQ